MVNKLVTYSLLAAVLLTAIAFAGERDYRSPFAIGIGARELGKGGAAVAGLSNAGAIYWNPALLAIGDKPEIQLFHTNLFMDTRYEFAALSYPTISSGGFGLGIGDLSSGNFNRYENYLPAGEFSSRQNILLAGYGFSPLKNLAFGASIKGVLIDIDSYRGSGFGFDLGMIYIAQFIKGLSMGIKATDLTGPRVKLNEIQQRYPSAFRGGIAYDRKFTNVSMSLNFDVENTEKSGGDIYTGGEFGIGDILFARVGYLGDRATFGGGLAYSGIRFDYAYLGLDNLGTSHRISLNYSFGGSVAQRRAAHENKIAADRIKEYDNNIKAEAQQKLEKQLAEARELDKQSDPYKTLAAYYSVLGMDDQNAEAIQKISSLFDQIKLDISRQASNTYIADLISRQLSLGNSYLEKKQYDKAAQQYGFVLILDPQNRSALSQNASIDSIRQAQLTRDRATAREAIQAGNYRKALETLDGILAISPDDQQAQQGRNQIYRIIESNKYLDKALKLYDQENYQAALVQTDSALALNPQSDGARGLKRRLAQYTAKETTLEDIKKNAEHWQIYLQGMDMYQSGNYEKAIELWRSLQQHYPNNPNLKRNIEQASDRAGKR
jgi:tetratricopeptide (TPR) repeat protein